METRSASSPLSSDNSSSIWIILAVLLVVSGLVGLGALTLLTSTQQGQVATGSQSAPSR